MTDGGLREVMNNKVVLTISAAELLRLLGRSGVWVFIPIFFLKEGYADYMEIGVMFMVSAFATIPTSLFGGNLVDKIGRRRIALIVPPAISLLFLLMFLDIYYKFNILLSIAAFVLFQPIASLQSIVDNVIITDSTLESERINAFSVTRIGANIGFSLGPAIAGFALAYNYAILAIIPMVAEMFGFTLYYKYVRYIEPPSQGTKKLTSFPRGDFRFLIISILISLAWFSVGPWAYVLPQFLSNVDMISSSTVGLLIASNGVAVVLLQVPVNRALVRMNDLSRVALGLVIYAITFAIFGFVRNTLLLLGDIVVLTLGENIISPASNAIIGKIAPESKRGEYYGGFNLVNSFLGPFSPLAYEFLLAFFHNSPIILWGIIGLICTSLAIVLFSFGIKLVPKR